MNYIFSLVLAIIASLFAGMGALMLKLSNKKVRHIFFDSKLFLGFVFYGLSTVLFVIALTGANLTILYPLASLNYVWVSLLSQRYLKEKMNKFKWSGIILIMVGVYLII